MKNADTPITSDSGGVLDLTDGTMDDGYFSQDGRAFSTGLTKREHFASMAMQGLLSNSGGVIQANSMSGTGWCNSDSRDMAALSVECADALLKELSK